MNDKVNTKTAVLYSNTPPSDEQKQKFILELTIIDTIIDNHCLKIIIPDFYIFL